jgi:hypothetical protein
VTAFRTEWKHREGSAEYGIYLKKESKNKASIIVYTNHSHSQGGYGAEADYYSFRHKCKLWDNILSMHGTDVLDEVIAACDTLVKV